MRSQVLCSSAGFLASRTRGLHCGMVFIGVLASLRSRKKKHLAGTLDPLWSVVQYRSACFSAEQNKKETLGGNAGSSADWGSLSECLLLCGAEFKENTWRECLLLCGMVFNIGVLASLRSRIKKNTWWECLLLCGVLFSTRAELRKTLGGNAGCPAECSSAEWCSLSECLLLFGAKVKKTLGRNA